MLKDLKILNQLKTSVQNKLNNDDSEITDDKKTWFRYRAVPIWLRIVLVLLLWLISMIIGLMIGFSVLGDGNAFDVFKWGTWQHIFDIKDGKS